MQHGGAKHHRQRVGEALKDEIAIILEGELADPRIGLASVSEVHLSPDGRIARVFVIVPGSDAETAEAMKGLDAAKNYIRRELTERLHWRQAPELFFQLDRADQYGSRIDELLNRIEKRRK
ncbi:MAG TPA: 30S ribosome-binding factor RbfA [Terriglobales bacterium]|nr:30S ribosome-binding factor RbfA [Terriglobales bacterium]